MPNREGIDQGRIFAEPPVTWFKKRLVPVNAEWCLDHAEQVYLLQPGDVGFDTKYGLIPQGPMKPRAQQLYRIHHASHLPKRKTRAP